MVSSQTRVKCSEPHEQTVPKKYKSFTVLMGWVSVCYIGFVAAVLSQWGFHSVPQIALRLTVYPGLTLN